MSSTNRPLRSAAVIQQYGDECSTPQGNKGATRSRLANVTGSIQKPENEASLHQGSFHGVSPQSQASVLSEFTLPVSLASDVSGFPSTGLASLRPFETLSQLSPLLLQNHIVAHRNAMLSALQQQESKESQLLRSLQLVRDFQLHQQGIATSTTVSTSTPMHHADFLPQNPATLALYQSLFLSR